MTVERRPGTGVTWRRSARLAALALLLAAGPARAERYALLVGVSKYAATGGGVSLDLEGPAEDVPALRRALVEQQGFAPANVAVLLNEAATRHAMLAALAQRVAALKDGDYLLFYFSGHGTSAFDAKMQPVSAFIGPNSGALAPFDLQIDSSTHAAESLVIGRRDLRPILEKVPRGSRVLVILDACYSENSVRAVRQLPLGRSRGITLGTLLPAATPPDGTTATVTEAAETAYPYPNVFALTAASKDEPAIDIDSRMARDGHYPTVDGRAHGALTNGLLEALSGAGDVNHDGTLTFQELYDFSRRVVQARFPHTPQLLVPAAVSTSGPAFGTMARPRPASACVAAPQVPPPAATARLDGINPAVIAALRAAGVQIVPAQADFALIAADGGVVDLFDASGTLVRRYRRTEWPELVARVQGEPALQAILAFQPTCPSFSVSVQLRPEGWARFSSRDRMDVAASLERDAYVVLLNVDKAGRISLVYPVTEVERSKQTAGSSLMLATVRAAPPFGSEHLKLLAFDEAPAFADMGCRADSRNRLQCPDFVAGSPGFAALQQLIQRAVAESRIRFVTYED